MAINEEEIEEFLEHRGVKGMKWGRRKSPSKPMSDRKKKIVKGVAIGVAAGALAGGSALLARRGMVSVKEANRRADAKAVKALMDVHRHIKMRQVDPKVAAEVKQYGEYVFRGGT